MKSCCSLALCVVLMAGCASRKTGGTSATPSTIGTAVSPVSDSGALSAQTAPKTVDSAAAGIASTSTPAPAPAANAWIIGEWIEDFGPDGHGHSTFNADGTYSGRFLESASSSEPLVTFSGRWKIEGDVITYELIECSDADFLRTNRLTKDRILKIEAARFTYADESNDTWTMMRVTTK